MAAPLINSMAPIKLNSTVLAVDGVRVPANILNVPFQHSGNLFSSIDMVTGAIPRARFRTPLAPALSLIGLGVLNLTTIEIQFANFVTLVRDPSSTHTKWSGTAGCAYLTGFSVSQGGVAWADVEVIAFSSDGATYPLTRADNTALNTLGSEPVIHTMGPMSLNGTVITGWDSMTVDLGQNVIVGVGGAPADGDLYVRTAALVGGAPMIRGTHKDPRTALTATTLIGTAITSNFVAYCKQYTTSTQVVGTANAVSLTVASGRVLVDSINDDQGKVLSVGLNVVCQSSTSTHPIAFSVAATSPAT